MRKQRVEGQSTAIQLKILPAKSQQIYTGGMMKGLNKNFLLATALVTGLLIGCGKDNGQDSTQANTPQPGTHGNCLEQGGYNCTNYSVPPGWSHFPRDQRGYYSGYNNGAFQNYQYCPYGTTAIIYPGNNLYCMPLNNQHQNYQWQYYEWRGGNFQQGCSVRIQNCPAYSRCINDYQQHQQGRHHHFSDWGICVSAY